MATGRWLGSGPPQLRGALCGADASLARGSSLVGASVPGIPRGGSGGRLRSVTFGGCGSLSLGLMMLQNMIPKSWRAMKFYFTTVYQEVWVGLALTTYAYYKISYGGKKAVADKSSGHH